MLDWLASGLTLTGSWFVGRRKTWAHLVLAAGSVAWAVYAFLTKQYPLLALNCVFMAVGVYNWLDWRSRARGGNPNFDAGRIGPGAKIETGRCCAMSRKFMTGVTGARADVPMPTDAADYIIDWSPGVQPGQVRQKPSRRKGPAQMILLGAKYCQWCGADIGDAVYGRQGRK